MNCSVQTIDTPRCADQHWVKNVHFQSFSGPYFPAVRLNTDIYSVNLHIQSGCRKIRTKKTPIMDTFRAVQLYSNMD